MQAMVFSLSILDCRCTIEFHAQCFPDEWNKWIDRRKPVSHYNHPLAMDMNALRFFLNNVFGIFFFFFRFKIIYLACAFSLSFLRLFRPGGGEARTRLVSAFSDRSSKWSMQTYGFVVRQALHITRISIPFIITHIIY